MDAKQSIHFFVVFIFNDELRKNNPFKRLMRASQGKSPKAIARILPRGLTMNCDVENA